MKIRRFEGKDAEEALRLAREALGPDAVVLQTRAVKGTGIKALVGRPRVEVLAAVDRHADDGTPAAGGSRFRVPGSRLGARSEGDTPQEVPGSSWPHDRTLSMDHSDLEPAGGGPPPSNWQGELTALRLEVARLRLQLHQSARETKARPEGGSRLERSGFQVPASDNLEPRGTPPPPCPPGFAAPSWNFEPPSGASKARMSGQAERILDGLVTRPIEIREGTCTAVAVVGPTGVGKTTTLAKLAAAATHVERRRVAFLTVDTYRLGAVEQLEAYARLLAIPLRVASSAEEVQAARRSYADYDLVLVDTVGRSPHSTAQITEMAALLEAALLDEVHLVMDAGAGAEKHASVLRGFEPLRPTQLLLSKLDEASGALWAITDALDAAREGGLPLSYITTGQRVPEDLAPADRDQLAQWLSGGA